MKNNEQPTYANNNSASPENYYHDDEISLFEILSIVWKRKFFIILSVFICIAITGLYLTFYSSVAYKTHAVLSLNFPGIEKHNNPDNSSFNKYQIIKPSILSKIDFFSDSSTTPEAKSKRSMLGIDDVIPQKILDEMKKQPAKTYLTNMFSLSLTMDKATTLSESERSVILTSIIEEYKKDFLNRYMKEVSFAESIPDNFFESNDYIEVVEILKTRIDNAVTLLKGKIATTGNFRSLTNNLSFSDLKGDFEILKNVELSRIQDVVANLNLTKDKNILIIKLKQKIKSLEAETKKESGRAAIAQNLLDKITLSSAKGTSGLNLPAGATLETSFIEKLRKEDNLSYLIKTILEAKSNANDLLIEKDQIIEIIKGLEQGLTVKENSKNILYVESALKGLIGNYKSLAGMVNDLNRSFLNIKFANAIKIEQNPISEVVRGKKASLIIVLAGIASLFISIFAAFFVEYIINANQEKQKNAEQGCDPPRELTIKRDKADDSQKNNDKSNVA